MLRKHKLFSNLHFRNTNFFVMPPKLILLQIRNFFIICTWLTPYFFMTPKLTFCGHEIFRHDTKICSVAIRISVKFFDITSKYGLRRHTQKFVLLQFRNFLKICILRSRSFFIMMLKSDLCGR